jgi:hypothetical protein
MLFGPFECLVLALSDGAPTTYTLSSGILGFLGYLGLDAFLPRQEL